MKKRGPKPIYGETLTRKQVTIDSMTLRKLMVIGGGNLSAGVRLSAETAFDAYQASPDSEKPKEKGR